MNYTSRPCTVPHLGHRRPSYLARPVASSRQSNIRRDSTGGGHVTVASSDIPPSLRSCESIYKIFTPSVIAGYGVVEGKLNERFRATTTIPGDGNFIYDRLVHARLRKTCKQRRRRFVCSRLCMGRRLRIRVLTRIHRSTYREHLLRIYADAGFCHS